MAGCTNQVSYEVVYTSIYACAHMMHALIGSYIACIILYYIICRNEQRRE